MLACGILDTGFHGNQGDVLRVGDKCRTGGVNKMKEAGRCWAISRYSATQYSLGTYCHI